MSRGNATLKHVLMVAIVAVCALGCSRERSNIYDPESPSYIGVDCDPFMQIEATASINDTLCFQGGVTCGDPPGVRYSWDYDGDNIWDNDMLGAEDTYYAYPDSGIYTPRLRLVDTTGEARMLSAQIHITNLPPTLTMCADTVATTLDEVPMWATVTDDGNDIMTMWDFDGDGVDDWISMFQENLLHRYQEPGIYTRRIVLRDDDNNEISGTSLVEVFRGVGMPVGDFIYLNTVPENAEVYLGPRGSFDSDLLGETETYIGNAPLMIDAPAGSYDLMFKFPVSSLQGHTEFIHDEAFVHQHYFYGNTLVAVAAVYEIEKVDGRETDVIGIMQPAELVDFYDYLGDDEGYVVLNESYLNQVLYEHGVHDADARSMMIDIMKYASKVSRIISPIEKIIARVHPRDGWQVLVYGPGMLNRREASFREVEACCANDRSVYLAPMSMSKSASADIPRNGF